MIDLTRLQVFLYAAETSSFSEAAQRMHVTQPTVSHHIKSLERELSVELFDRSGGEMKLTEAGRLLLPRARKLLRDSIEVQQMMHSLEQRIVGHLRIACSTTTGKYILPQFAARFHQRHPGVRVSILRCISSDVMPRLLEGKADLGVVSFDGCKEGFDCQEFFWDHIILIASADHPWATRKEIDPDELLEAPIIMREATSGTSRVLSAELGKHDIDLNDLDIFLELGNAEAIVKTVEAGFGVSFVSRTAAIWAMENGTVVEIAVSGFDLHRKIYMIRKNLHEANRAMEAFWAFVHDSSNTDLLQIAET